MNYDQVIIDKVDNGYIVTTSKKGSQVRAPEQNAVVFLEFEDVLSYLKGDRAVVV